MLHVEQSLCYLAITETSRDIPWQRELPVTLRTQFCCTRSGLYHSQRFVYLTRKRIIDLRPSVMNLRERLYLAGTRRASKSRHL